jgi:MATE family multidrug resistance protein
MAEPRFLQITIPVALTYFGLMALGMVDLLLVGRIGAAEQGAVGVGTSFFAWFLVFGIGLLSAMDYFVSTAFGSGRPHDAASMLIQGLWTSTWLALPLTAVLLGIATRMELFGVHPAVAPLAAGYLKVLALSLWPVYLFAAARNYLQALHRVWEAFALLIAANALNWILNMAWIPQLGVEGSAWATVASRVLMAAAMVGLALWHARPELRSLQRGPALKEQFELLRLGLPAALQGTAEAGVFALSTILAARLAPEAVAAHQIVLNLASMTFMVPLGIGTAAAVCVGFFLGRSEPGRARTEGWRALRYTLLFMSCTAILFSLAARPLLEIYTRDSGVLALAVPVMVVVALFQLFDGTQTVLTGALRGWGDTKSAFYLNLAGHWALGLPIGLWLGFSRKMGILGIWIGLATGLTAVALALLWTWNQRTSSSTASRVRE